MSKPKILKPKKCKSCGAEFIPKNSLQKVCSTKCALDLARQNAQKERDKAEKKKLNERKARLRDEDRGYWLKSVQREVNKYIRLGIKGCHVSHVAHLGNQVFKPLTLSRKAEARFYDFTKTISIPDVLDAICLLVVEISTDIGQDW